MTNHRIITIGRADDNDIILDEVSISRYHLRLFVDGELNVFVTDLKSTNGTYVNGKKITGTLKLQKNDILKAGFSRKPIRWMSYVSGELPSRISQGVIVNKTEVKLKEAWLLKGVLLAFVYLIALAVVILIIIKITKK